DEHLRVRAAQRGWGARGAVQAGGRAGIGLRIVAGAGVSEGKLFRSTVRGGHPAMFVVGDSPTAWWEALRSMVVGENVRLWVGGSDAFGEKPAENLVYEIELLAL